MVVPLKKMITGKLHKKANFPRIPAVCAVAANFVK